LAVVQAVLASAAAGGKAAEEAAAVLIHGKLQQLPRLAIKSIDICLIHIRSALNTSYRN